MNTPLEELDTFDAQDVQNRIDEIEAELADPDLCEDVEDFREELSTLRELLEDIGEEAQMIRHSYFEQYTQQFAEDVGAVNEDARWPNCHIDWTAAARDLSMDYSSIRFAGTDWFYRG